MQHKGLSCKHGCKRYDKIITKEIPVDIYLARGMNVSMQKKIERLCGQFVLSKKMCQSTFCGGMF